MTALIVIACVGIGAWLLMRKKAEAAPPLEPPELTLPEATLPIEELLAPETETLQAALDLQAAKFQAELIVQADEYAKLIAEVEAIMKAKAPEVTTTLVATKVDETIEEIKIAAAQTPDSATAKKMLEVVSKYEEEAEKREIESGIAVIREARISAMETSPLRTPETEKYYAMMGM